MNLRCHRALYSMCIYYALNSNMAVPASTVSSARSGCPQKFACFEEDRVSFDVGRLPTYFSIASSSLSVLGSLLIFLVYFKLKERRSIAQKIITLLAIADLFTALGYLLAAWNFLTHFGERDQSKCLNVFQPVCAIQSYITTWSSLCSFGWTCALALHFYLVLSPTKKHLPPKLLVYENIVAWFVPIVIVLPLLCTDKLGFTQYAASNWCFIKDADIYPSSEMNRLTISLMLVAGELWEMLSYVFVVLMYGLTRCKLHKQMQRNRQGSVSASLINSPRQAEIQTARSEVKQRLLLIPIVFFLLRISGTLHFIYSLAMSSQNIDGCIPRASQKVFLVFAILQAIGDGGQGWGNALLYVFLSPIIRKELISLPFFKCIERVGYSIKAVGDRVEKLGQNNHLVRSVEQHTHPPAIATGSAAAQQENGRSFARITSISRVSDSDFRRAHTGPMERADIAPPLPQDRLNSIEESFSQ